MCAVSRACIRLRGVRQNNLKNVDLDVPLRQLVVVAGLSGSGKSSLAFDTLFAEGQRRYIETFSPYARQFLDRMDKPQAESIEGIPPAIAIEQRNTVKSTRSTVGTMTEITEYTKAFWARLARLHCRQCGQTVNKDAPAEVWKVVGGLKEEPSPRPSPALAGEGELSSADSGIEALISFDLALSEKFPLEESLSLIGRQGYQRLLLEGVMVSLEESADQLKKLRPSRLTVIQDRVKLAPANRARFVQACEQAYHFGHGKLAVRFVQPGSREAGGKPHLFSSGLHCAKCDLDYREAMPALFSFNHPIGACPTCRGFGRIIAIDYNAAIPDWSKTLAEGAVKPWQTASNAECQDDMMKFARRRGVPTDVPFGQLPQKWKDWVIEGDEDHGKDEEHRWPKSWYGVKGYFRWLESRAYKMHVRVLLSRYRVYKLCPVCHGARFQPEALLYRVNGSTLADFYRMTVRQALAFVQTLGDKQDKDKARSSDPALLALQEVRSRLAYLEAAGLGYLSLDRPTRSLSGGETERVNLTACLGSCLVNTLFVLDEPSVGLHPRDTARLVNLVQKLRDVGNTVVVVEHEASVMRAADQIIELGPGHGESGGEIVFQGSYPEILRAKHSLTGSYLAGRRQIDPPSRRSSDALGKLILRHAALHNLKDLTVDIPLGRLVCVTGVSGSGKSTLVTEVLVPALRAKLHDSSPATTREMEEDADSDSDEAEGAEAGPVQTEIEGWEKLGGVIAVDQSPIGRTPRSNPAVYIGAFEDIRVFFAQDQAARQRGLNASAFSFNSVQGQCERCRGAGFEKIEMQFLSDVFVRCPDCNGRRYRSHILEVTIAGRTKSGPRNWSVADVLEASVDEAIEFFSGFPDSRPAARAVASLKWLQDTGLGYLRLGQPVNTLSGGESQRLKLVNHLAQSQGEAQSSQNKPTLFVFDEPTTGLHFDDVRVLLQVLQRLVDRGHSVLVIEHNLDVIRSADWLIDLGPEAGEEGGRLVAEGTPEEVMGVEGSHTGRALWP